MKRPNGELYEFDPQLRIPFDPASVDWIVLKEMLEAGNSMYQDLADQRASKIVQRNEAKKRKVARSDRLRVKDPW